MIQGIQTEIDRYYKQPDEISYLIDLYGGTNYTPCGLFDEYQDIQIILQYREKVLEECKNKYSIQQTHQQVKDKELEELEHAQKSSWIQEKVLKI